MFPIVLIGAIAVQAAVAMVVVLAEVARGIDVQQALHNLAKLITAPIPFILVAGLAQLMVFLGAVIPARLSPEPTFRRLGLGRPSVPAWSYPLFALGTAVPFAVGLVPAYFLSKATGPNQALVNLYKQMTWSVAVPFILFIAIAPAITEELFFRGYMQRRLLERWPAWLAILVTSCLFTLLHLEPVQMVYVFPIGIWLGVVAWRAGSVWPTMLCHAFLNGSWNIFQIGSQLLGLPDELTDVIAYSAAGVGFVCFCGSIWVLIRRCGETVASQGTGEPIASTTPRTGDPLANPGGVAIE
jgi:membrane protease YdiL (CAAX protease family)